jgi:hypothetical protein
MLDQLDTLIAFALIMLLFSLLITTFVQAFNVVLQRRGFNLVWGVAQVLEQMGVNGNQAKAIAKKVLMYPALSPSRFLPVYAQAVRAGELAKVLGKVMPGVVYPNGVPANPPDWYVSTLQAADSLEKRITHRVPDFNTLSAVLQALGAELGAQVSQVLTAPAVDPGQLQSAILNALRTQASGGFRTLREAVDSVAVQVVQELGRAVNPAAAATGQPPPANIPTVPQVRQAIDSVFQTAFAAQMTALWQKAADFKTWFDIVMDRTSERFVAWTRWVTVIASFVFCLVLQVDGLDILKKLYTDKQLRATLVAQVDPTLKQAGDIMALASTALGTDALRELESDLKAAGITEKIDSNLDTRAKGEKWLNDHIQDDETKKAVIKKYNEKFEALAQKRLDKLGAAQKDLLKKLDDSQLQLFPASGEIDIKAWFNDMKDWHHLGGILMAGLLLSLGAPFWFNMLKNLSNLRPILANRVDQQAEEPGGNGT